MRLVSLAVLSLILGNGVCLADTATQARSKLSATFRTAHFTVHYDPSDPYLARIMAQGAEQHLSRIARDLGCRLDRSRPFPLYIYPTHMGFIKAGRLEEHKFTLGTAHSNETISIDASGVFESADRVMAHEITHAVIFRILASQARRLPLWVNEGLAEYYSQDYPDAARTIVADAAADGSLMPLANLEESFPEKRTELAYAQSHLAVLCLVEEHGRSAPRRLVSALAEGGSFDEAVRNVTGVGESDFRDRWYQAATARYWPLRLTRIGMGIISALMACLVIVAFLVRRKQKIEAARRWEQEEFEEHLRRQLGNDWYR